MQVLFNRRSLTSELDFPLDSTLNLWYYFWSLGRARDNSPCAFFRAAAELRQGNG